MSETYNGWTNRETWAVALHINNDQGWQESVHERLADARDNYEPTDELDHFNSGHAGDIIRENVEELFDSIQTEPDMRSRERIGMTREIGSLWRVNWTELGASFLEELD